nr:alpha/beta hydrolase [Bradyrhizobium valentinum]
MKHIVLVSVAAMFFVASPSFAQQKGTPSSEMKTKEARVNGLTLHYIELGQGTPVVLVHGTLEDYRTWDGQLEAFSKGYRLISYSRRYHYPNESPKDATDFSVTIHARDLAAFIKALNLPRFISLVIPMERLLRSWSHEITRRPFAA